MASEGQQEASQGHGNQGNGTSRNEMGQLRISEPIQKKKDGPFDNPRHWGTWTGLPGMWSLLKWKCETDYTNVPSDIAVKKFIRLYSMHCLARGLPCNLRDSTGLITGT